MSEIPGGADHSKILKELASRRGAASQQLAKAYGDQRSTSGMDKLTQIASKRNADTVKFSYFLMKQRLIGELGETLQGHFAKHPEMEGKVFVGVITDEDFRSEVVNLDDATEAVTDVPPEEARKVLSQNPIGYFSSADFNMRTPDEEGYKELQDNLDKFFRRNKDIFDYLRAHPEADVDASELYKVPNS